MKKLKAAFALLFALSLAANGQDPFAQTQIQPAAARAPGGAQAPAQSAGSAQTSVSAQASVSAKAAVSTKADPKEILEKAMAGDAGAQLALGSFYALGQGGFPKDAAQAVNWITKSARQNFAPAQVYLGILYGNGSLVKRDLKEAVRWRELGAENGGAQEKWVLGNAYLFGYLVPKDPERAVYWIESAAELNHPDALVKILEIYSKNGDAQKYAKWSKRFSELEVDAAKNGNVLAMNSIAKKYLRGRDGLPRNVAQGVYWYSRAAENGNLDSAEILAKMYARGRYVSKNPKKARELFMKIAEKDPSYALKVSNLYMQGKDGFPKDEEQAFYWLEHAAEKMDDLTRLYVAWRYWSGTNAPKDLQRAVFWCEKCSELREPAQRMARDIRKNKPAPENLTEYVDMKVDIVQPVNNP